MLKILRFGSDNESLFGMFDGGRNNDVPKIILDKIGEIVRDEMLHHHTANMYMKYSMLSMHRLVIVI